MVIEKLGALIFSITIHQSTSSGNRDSSIGYHSAMRVRLGTSADWPAVLPMLRKHRALHEGWDKELYALRADAEKRFRQWLGHAAEDPRALLMVMEGENGTIVGFLTALIEKDVPIYVADEFVIGRRTGPQDVRQCRLPAGKPPDR